MNKLKQQFNEMIKNLNNTRGPQEYIIYGGAETFKQMDEAVSKAIWAANNPLLGPEQKWYYADGFYKVLKDFGEAKAGDILFFKSYVHSRVVKIATATEKQVFFDYKESMNTGMKFTPEEWTALRPLTKWELLKIFPHPSERIKRLSAYYEIMKSYPEKICDDCISLLNLYKRQDWLKFHKAHRGKCDNCKEIKADTTFRNALKPIGL